MTLFDQFLPGRYVGNRNYKHERVFLVLFFSESGRQAHISSDDTLFCCNFLFLKQKIQHKADND